MITGFVFGILFCIGVVSACDYIEVKREAR